MYSLLSQNLHDLPYHLHKLFELEMAGFIQDDLPVRRKEAIGPHIAPLLETACLEVLIAKGNGRGIPDLLAGDLAQDEVVTFQLCDDQRRTSFRLC